MKNKELENRVYRILPMMGALGQKENFMLVEELVKEVERLEAHVTNVTLLRAKIASEQLAAANVGKSLDQRHYDSAAWIAKAIQQADMLIEELARTERK